MSFEPSLWEVYASLYPESAREIGKKYGLEVDIPPKDDRSDISSRLDAIS